MSEYHERICDVVFKVCVLALIGILSYMQFTTADRHWHKNYAYEWHVHEDVAEWHHHEQYAYEKHWHEVPYHRHEEYAGEGHWHVH